MKEYLKKYWYFILIILVVIPFCFLNSSDDEVAAIEVKEENIVSTYYVDIKGEVNNPGVYEVSSNDRIKDVIDLAGGLTKNADISLLNLSKKVYDEMNIKIYSKSEIDVAHNIISSLYKEPEVIEVIKEVEKVVEKECECEKNDACENSSDIFVEYEDIEEKSSLININTATKDELMTLTGIGESKALKIIEYRNTSKFVTKEDIKNVSGIGESVYEKIKDYITV